MKIIFLNTWRSKLRSELRAYIQNNLQDTAVFCFQEATEKDTLLYDDILSINYVAHAVERKTDDITIWYGNVIYVRKDLVIKEIGSIFDDYTDEFEGGLAAYLTVKINETELTICNVHGIPQPGDKLDSPARLRQSKVILDTFKDRQAVIIGGDFNLLPDTKSIQLFSEHGYQDLIADFKIQTTRNYITHEKYPNSIQHFADYAFVSPDIKVTDFVVPSEVVSDHQPLELEVDVEDLEVVAKAAGATRLFSGIENV